MVGHGLDPTTVTPPPSPHSRQNNSVIDTPETSGFTAITVLYSMYIDFVLGHNVPFYDTLTSPPLNWTTTYVLNSDDAGNTIQ